MDASDLDRDPLRQIDKWLEAARAAGDPMPEAMCLATTGRDREPSARFVLLRGRDEGVVFFTDYESEKGRDLQENPKAAAVLHWYAPVHRQVRISGTVVKTSAEDSDLYWASRPPGSRRSAVASHQSSVVATRDELEAAVAALGDTEPPRPERWGGYRLVPAMVEFWEEQPFRLHDRIRFVRDRGGWRIERLAP
jgi:pyridoxamine 5'-phosphate oxidase